MWRRFGVRRRRVLGLCFGLEISSHPPPSILRKVFKVDTLSPDFNVRRSKKSYKMRFMAAKYS
jgi:hypothetical protein